MKVIASATAPSNIALIKYMGKTSHVENTPSNPSLSWSIEHLVSKVVIGLLEDSVTDVWSPLDETGFFAPNLSEKGQLRFLAHFRFLKDHFGIRENYEVQSANNFPADCGVASSASSFAALTIATFELGKKLGNLKKPLDMTLEDLSQLSRLGSGSSCRSLFPAWSSWSGDGAVERQFPLKNLRHILILLDEKKKQVSSSEAHQRVTTSPNFSGRVERATSRLLQLEQALNSSRWIDIYQTSLEEFEDMHNLFETSVPPFSYRNSYSAHTIGQVRQFWKSRGDGPVVTMDAGANVHLLWREDQFALAEDLIEQLRLSLPTMRVLTSPDWKRLED